jgi:hypothetical protein
MSQSQDYIQPKSNFVGKSMTVIGRARQTELDIDLEITAFQFRLIELLAGVLNGIYED